MARLMGDVGKPVQLAVLEALHNNPEFELVLCGHSLGAGVAALLGMVSDTIVASDTINDMQV